jgi:hypothetical protein
MDVAVATEVAINRPVAAVSAFAASQHNAPQWSDSSAGTRPTIELKD